VQTGGAHGQRNPRPKRIGIGGRYGPERCVTV
jgi:hypothetical protein